MFKKNKQAVVRDNANFHVSKARVVTILAVTVFVTVALLTSYTLKNKEFFPIDTVRAQGSFVYVTEDMLNTAIEKVDKKGFFTIDVAKVKKQIESLAWVKHASIKRVWPGTLNISVIERKPIAILQSGGVVDSTGEVFHPDQTDSLPKNMVIFDVSVAQIKSCLNYYFDSVAMLKNMGLEVTRVTYSNRQALRYRLNNQFNLVLGNENKLYRLNRFAKIYENNLKINNESISSIDMRYTNGFSVEWKAGHKPADVSRKNIAQVNRESGHV